MARKPSKKPRSKQPTNSRKRGRGRPSDFRPEFADQAERLCKLHKATDEDLAAFFEKGLATIQRWKSVHVEFRDAIKRGKVQTDIDVAGKIHDRAMGCEVEEQHAIKVKDIIYEDGKKIRETERIEIVTLKKQYPPDTMAGMYWLNNRQKEHWRQRHEITGKDGGPLDVNLNEVRGGIASKLDRIAAAIEKASVSR